MTDSDQVAAYLAGVRERTGRPLAHPGALPISNDAARGLMESAADVPRLLATVETALAWHGPDRSGGQTVCTSCGDAYGEHVEWPCGEYKDLSRALLGEGESNA